MRGALRYLALLGGLLLISFALPRALPGDPLANLAATGGTDAELVLSPQAHGQLLAYYGLDRPLPEQALRFLGETVRGDLGFSIGFSRPVSQLIADRLPWTLLLVCSSLLVAGIAGSAIGLLAGYRPSSYRRLSAVLVLIGALPDFVVGILLLVGLGVILPILPSRGAATGFQDCSGPAVVGCAGDVATHAILPVLTLAIVQLPAFFLLMRAATLGELAHGYLVPARARGLTERRLAVRHVAPNASLPVITLVGLRFGTMLGGVVVVETLFSYPGLGQLTYQAALSRDFPVLQALFLLGGLAILVLNAAADLARRRVDPRLRLEAAP